MTDLSPTTSPSPSSEVDPEIAEVLENEAARQETTLEMIASENFVPAGDPRLPGIGAHEQVRRGLSRPALLRRLRVRGRRRAAGDRSREGALRRRARQRAAARRRAGQRRRLPRAARAGRPHPRHEARPRRPPHARHEDQLLRAGSTTSSPTACARRTRCVDMDELARLAEDAPAQADPRRLVGLPAPARLRRASARSPTRWAPTWWWTWRTSPASWRPRSTPARCPTRTWSRTTVHKTLGGARGGMILCREEFAKKIDSAVFPGQQGGPLMHVIAGKAVAMKIAQSELFRERQRRTREGAAARGRGDALGRRERAHRRHRRAPRARRPARLRARRPAGRGPPARDRHHREPQRGAVRPAPAGRVVGRCASARRRSPPAASRSTTSARSAT